VLGISRPEAALLSVVPLPPWLSLTVLELALAAEADWAQLYLPRRGLSLPARGWRTEQELEMFSVEVMLVAPLTKPVEMPGKVKLKHQC
jgi:hypothetical protein